MVVFMVFALFESLGFFALTFALYRLKLEEYWLPILVISIVMQLVNFYMRVEANLAFLGPIVLLLFIIMFMISVVKIPIFWAIVVSVTGILAFTVLQGLFALLAVGINFLSSDKILYSGWQANILQVLTGLLAYVIGRYLYRRGLGFAFMFDKFQFHLKTIGIVIMLLSMTTVLGAIFYINNLYTVLAALLVGLSFFLYYAQRKEKTDAHDGL